MNESPFKTSERLSNILKSKEILIQNSQNEIYTLNSEVKTLKEKLEEKDSKLKQMSQSATSKPNIIPAPQPVQPPQKVKTPAAIPTLNNAHQGTN